MGRQAGTYKTRYEWLQQSITVDALGHRTEAFASNGYLWGHGAEFTGHQDNATDAERSGVAATIRVRNYPDVSVKDRLYDDAWGETWIIRTVTRGDNELTLDVVRYDPS